MLTIGGRWLKGPTESAHTRPLQPFGLRSLSWSQSGSASPALVLVTVSSAPSRKSVVEKEVEGASSRASFGKSRRFHTQLDKRPVIP